MIKATGFNSSMHVDEQDLLETNKNCVFCCSKDLKKLFNVQKKPAIMLVKCKRCKAVSVDRFPKDGLLKDYYESYYSVNKTGVTFSDIERFSAVIFDGVRNLSKKRMKILDFGGGSGSIAINIARSMLKEKKANSVEITIVDYNSFSIEDIGNIEVNWVDTLEKVNEKRFDLVIASAIVEHIPRGDSVRKLLRLVDKGGIVYFRTPFVVPIIRLFKLFKINIDFTFPGHLHDLGKDFWENILDIYQIENFKILSYSASPVESNFKTSFIRTFAAHLFKFPSRFFNFYDLVGGWQIFFKKID
ncbi:MAG: hypothetical protein C0601_02715 [Candidatus Muiribacterium halophilum]|uniref:Methyltransferase domain-containing protein n=1 Tax=Muiribacterium halophilum TaxID=2053465 RepID=A0A2N5ZKH0_MUIH1|nr:MAG: hypothetical protein C0601_02715 [Candidatus Muirbacterium halophilum]